MSRFPNTSPRPLLCALRPGQLPAGLGRAQPQRLRPAWNALMVGKRRGIIHIRSCVSLSNANAFHINFRFCPPLFGVNFCQQVSTAMHPSGFPPFQPEVRP